MIKSTNMKKILFLLLFILATASSIAQEKYLIRYRQITTQ
nr:MAG TPA: YfaZ precursor [Caudoviricetes sp.]